MVGINHIGENVVDLECIVRDINGAGIKQIPRKRENGKTEQVDVLVLPQTNGALEFVVYDLTVDKYYRCRIDPNSKEIVNGNSLVANKKFDQLGGLTEINKDEYNNSNGIKLEVGKRSPGGGAINCGVGVQVFLNASDSNDITNRIVVPNGDRYIEEFLSEHYRFREYKPQGWNEGAGLNINFTFEGKTFTLRSPYEWPYKRRNGYDTTFIEPGDFLVINTIKDWGYLDGLLNQIDSAHTTQTILVATDSSMKAKNMGFYRVKELLSRCSVIISNDSELDELANHEELAERELKPRELGKEKNPKLLVEAMQKIWSEGQIVYTTLADRGIAVYDGKNVYRQGTCISQEGLNVNGCGDAATALIVLYTVLGRTVIDTLIDSNIAGQIDALLPTASSNDMATRERIGEFKGLYKIPPV